MSGSGPASSSSAPRVTLDVPVAQSLAATGHTKTSIANTLKVVADAGMIKDCDGIDDTNMRA